MALELDRVREIAERVAASSGLEVVDLEFRGSGKARMLRVFLDKPGAASGDVLAGVTHGDCANFSREFGTILDVEDAISDSYTLEVSSPGLDRRLSSAEDFQRFTGSLAKVQTRDPVDGNRHWQGRLQDVNQHGFTLDLTGAKQKSKVARKIAAKTVTLSFSNIEKANLVPEI